MIFYVLWHISDVQSASFYSIFLSITLRIWILRLKEAEQCSQESLVYSSAVQAFESRPAHIWISHPCHTISEFLYAKIEPGPIMLSLTVWHFLPSGHSVVPTGNLWKWTLLIQATCVISFHPPVMNVSYNPGNTTCSEGCPSLLKSTE